MDKYRGRKPGRDGNRDGDSIDGYARDGNQDGRETGTGTVFAVVSKPTRLCRQVCQLA